MEPLIYTMVRDADWREARAAGHRVVAVDDSFDRAGEVGLPMAG